MNRLFNESTLRRFNHITFPLVIVWSLSTFGSLFLASSSIERSSLAFEPFFEIFHFGDTFALSSTIEGQTRGKHITTQTLVPDPHRIRAIYRSGTGSFISIGDSKNTMTIVPLHGIYKGSFRLIALSDSAAVFRGYGKTYRLRMGYDDNLSRQESVTRFIPDPSEGPGGEKEWRTIPYEQIAQQMNNVRNITKMIDITPAGTGGFRVNTIAPNSLFAQLGIVQGDLILSVNNQKLSSYADAMAIYSQLPHLRSIRISVQRNNLPKDIVYEITR